MYFAEDKSIGQNKHLPQPTRNDGTQGQIFAQFRFLPQDFNRPMYRSKFKEKKKKQRRKKKKEKKPPQSVERMQSIIDVYRGARTTTKSSLETRQWPRTFGLGLVQEENVPVALSPSPFPSMLSRCRRYLCGCGCWLKKEKRNKERNKKGYHNSILQSFNPSIVRVPVPGAQEHHRRRTQTLT